MSDYIYKIGYFNVIQNHIRGYFISLRLLGLDYAIAEELNIKLSEYTEILKQFNAQFDQIFKEYFFENKYDAIKCVNYLNEKYGLIIKLIE